MVGVDLALSQNKIGTLPEDVLHIMHLSILYQIECDSLSIIISRLVSWTLYLTSGCTKYFLLAIRGHLSSTKSVGGLLCLNLSTLCNTVSLRILKVEKEESVLNPD